MFGINFSICRSAASRLAIISIMILLSRSLLQATAQSLPTSGVDNQTASPSNVVELILNQVYIEENYSVCQTETFLMTLGGLFNYLSFFVAKYETFSQMNGGPNCTHVSTTMWSC